MCQTGKGQLCKLHKDLLFKSIRKRQPNRKNGLRKGTGTRSFKNKRQIKHKNILNLY